MYISKHQKLIPLVAPLFFLTACQAPPNIQKLENENQSLQQQLSAANQRINTLESELTEANRVINVLEGEKTSRVTDSTKLRGEIRRFVQGNIDGLKGFLLDSNLLDYIGGEQVKRASIDYRPAFLIDLKNRVPRQGVLTGASGYFYKPTQLQIKILRQVKNNLVVIWESRPFNVKTTGKVTMRFPLTVGVEKGDIIGYYFDKTATVSFDKGTGNTRYINKNLPLGANIEITSLDGEKQKRAYSIGVYALLQ